MHKPVAALDLQERVSYVSATKSHKVNGDYVDGKTPNDLEDGALREGGGPVYTSPEVLALLAQYFAVGLMYGSLPSVPYSVLVQYFHLQGTQFTSAKALIGLGWSLKVFVGMLSDVCPILGFRRKSYMILGWLLCAACLLVLGVIDHGDPYDGARDGGKLNPENVAANARGTTVGLLCALATIAYILADVPADAMVVEYAQREPEHVRGRMQTLIYGVRTVASTITTALMGFCLNSERFHSTFSWDMGLNAFFLVLAVPTFVVALITYFFINDRKTTDAVVWAEYKAQFWGLVQKRCVWQLMIFNFAFNLFAGYITTTAAPYVAQTWAGVENLNSSIMGIVGSLIFAGMLAVMGKWGTMWNWRRWLVVTTLAANAIDAVVQYLTIYDIVRDQWFYLGVPLAEQIPAGIQFIITTFAIVEIADVGNEGIIYGLLTTCSNMPNVFGAMITNIYCDQFRVSDDDIARDDDDAKHQVAYTYLVYYGTTVFACCWVLLFPTQKKMLQEWKRDGEKYPVVGASALIIGFGIMVMSITSNVMTMFVSTKCLRFAGGHGCD
ncbi:hypothetical protein B5M09_005734 [Aphanomyces astaci]|uniref:Major facilitator superfamily associated domain-containing protein n=1 Tax=Aphanomyces astaci TaxID=112090 RepID=A0A3R7WG38_APHAT|nr:hypothetical protein B5M09_005734 [Aphanomyces astaci]